MFANFIKQEFTRNALTKMVALVAMPVLNQFKRVDHRRYNGAAFARFAWTRFQKPWLGDACAFENALNRAYDAARHRLLDRVHDRIAATLESLPRRVPQSSAAMKVGAVVLHMLHQDTRRQLPSPGAASDLRTDRWHGQPLLPKRWSNDLSSLLLAERRCRLPATGSSIAPVSSASFCRS